MLGIDIGKRYIKMVGLRWHRGRWRLQACVASKVAHKSGLHRDSDPAQAVIEALQLLPADMRKKLPRVGIALPTAELLVKTVDLPPELSPDQIDQALTLEFEQALMPDAERICLDYRRSGRQILAVACRQSLMDKVVATLAAAGIVPALASADAMLIADDLPSEFNSQFNKAGLGLYIDAGATGIRLHSMRVGIPLYSRSHALPDESCCDNDSAAWLLMLRRAIQQYRMSDMLSKPDAIMVYGGAATLPGVHELLQHSFGMPVHCFNPFSAWQIEDADHLMTPVARHACAFTLACALARQSASCV